MIGAWLSATARENGTSKLSRYQRAVPLLFLLAGHEEGLSITNYLVCINTTGEIPVSSGV